MLGEITSDPGEEMAAIAWFYAAVVEIGMDPAILFHAEQGIHPYPVMTRRLR